MTAHSAAKRLAASWPARLGIGIAAISALGILYARYIERRRVRLDRFVLTVDKPGLPAEGLIILHLSDFHFGIDHCIEVAKVRNLHRLLAGERYDLLVFTGDLVHSMQGLPAALALTRSLRPRLGAVGCLGNHDYAEYSVWSLFNRSAREETKKERFAAAIQQLAGFVRKLVRNELIRLPVAYNDITAIQAALARQGIHLLVNRALHIQRGGLDLWIAGVDDHTEGQPDLAAALASVPDGALLLLLSHSPDIWLDPAVERADLVLAGHTHGGQIRLPLVGAIHTQGTHLTRRRPAGWFRRNRAHMFVSQGVGESVPLRLGVRPQAALIHLLPSTPSPGD